MIALDPDFYAVQIEIEGTLGRPTSGSKEPMLAGIRHSMKKIPDRFKLIVFARCENRGDLSPMNAVVIDLLMIGPNQNNLSPTRAYPSVRKRWKLLNDRSSVRNVSRSRRVDMPTSGIASRNL